MKHLTRDEVLIQRLLQGARSIADRLSRQQRADGLRVRVWNR